MDNDLIVKEEVNIKNMIYTLRGKQVILDSDVALLYHYETKRINEVVKRNQERFPETFCFQLTKNEYDTLKSQIATSNIRGGKQKIPYVFSEKGIIMLSGLLKNEVAIDISIKIVEDFVEMRKFLMSNGQVFERLTNVEYKVLELNKRFDKVLNKLQDNKELYHIGASLKDLGKKCFGINKIEDKEILEKLISNI